MEERVKTCEELIQELCEARKRIFELDRLGQGSVSDLFLQAVVDTIDTPIFVKDDSHRFVFVNEKAAIVLAMSKADMLGKTDTDLFPPDQARQFWERDEQVLETGITQLNESVVTWNGGPRTILTTKSLFLDPATDRKYLVGTVVDITNRKLAEEELRAHKERMEDLVCHIPVMIAAYDQNGSPLYWNQECQRVLGFRSEEVVANPQAMQTLYPDAAVREQFVASRAVCDTEVRGVERKTACKKGEDRIISWTKAGCIAPVSGWDTWEVGEDVTDQRRAEEAERLAQAKYRAIFDQAPIGIFQSTPDGRYLAANLAHAKSLGFDTPEELIAEIDDISTSIFANPEDRDEMKRLLEEYGEIRDFEFQAKRRDGAPFWTSRDMVAIRGTDGEVLYYEGFARDITQRKRMEGQLRHMALHDHMTGLPNRTLCVDRIGRSIHRFKRREEYLFAVLFVDIDRFQVVNDTFGNALGDHVLQEVATRLQSSVRELDTVSRFGGDEFVILLEEIESYRMPIQIMRRVQEALTQPFYVDNTSIQLTASIGMVLWTMDYRSAEEILRNATIAMQAARKKGTGKFRVFSPSLLTEAMSLMTLEHDMDRAMGDEEFRLVFQPIVHLDGEDKLYGFEALIRWEHPTRGLIMPSDFIPLAEETDRIMFLGMWALRNACLAMAKFIKMHPKAGRLVMSVNLSAKQLVSTSLAVDILDVLELTGVPPAALNLEITETTLMEGGSAAIARLKDLADAGISFSIDDFGTGYSSMAYLSQLPLDNMKIDLSFVRMMDVNPNNIEIVRAIIQLAHSLGLEVVAEGVEKDVQRIKLMELGCEYYQGYLFSMPLSFQEAGQLIVNQLEAEH